MFVEESFSPRDEFISDPEMDSRVFEFAVYLCLIGSFGAYGGVETVNEVYDQYTYLGYLIRLETESDDRKYAVIVTAKGNERLLKRVRVQGGDQVRAGRPVPFRDGGIQLPSLHLHLFDNRHQLVGNIEFTLAIMYPLR